MNPFRSTGRALVLLVLLVVGACKQEPLEADLPFVERLAREWRLSAEEAQPGREVHRNADFLFPNQAYRPTYRFTTDQKVSISYQRNGSTRFYSGTWQLSEADDELRISAVDPVSRRAYVLTWRVVNLRSDLLLVEPQP